MLEVIKNKKGKVFIRNRADETGARPELVHPSKLQTWIAFSEAAHDSFGESMEEVNQSVSDKMSGNTFKTPEVKPKRTVTPQLYKSLLVQCAKKGITQKQLDKLVIVIEPTVAEPKPEEPIEKRIAREIAATLYKS